MKMKHKPEAVIFDMDGVLVDTEMYYVEAFEAFFAKEEVFVPRGIVNKSVGCTDIDFYHILQNAELMPWSFEEFVNLFNCFKKDNPLVYKERLNIEVPQTLEKLRTQGYKIGLASSTALAGIKRMLSECQLEHYFDNVLSGEMFERSKPNPEIYLKSAVDLDVPPAACLVVEDSNYGIAAAVAAGMTVAAKKDERFGFDQSKAHFQIITLDEIFRILPE